jgi:hypothetical protein
MVVVPGTPGVMVIDGRTAPRDPAIEDDLSFFGPPGIGDRERQPGAARGGGGNRN